MNGTRASAGIEESFTLARTDGAMHQQTLSFSEPPKLKPGTELAAVYEIMRSSRWWSLSELVEEFSRRGKPHLSTSVSARLRELRSRGFTVDSRIRDGARNTWEYRLSWGNHGG